MEDKDYYIRSKGRKPDLIKCNSNLIDDGLNCIDSIICKRVNCNDNNCIECIDNNIIKKYEDRLHCNQNEEKINDLCYKRCNSGYVAKGSKCVKGVDNVLSNKILTYDNNSININSDSNYLKMILHKFNEVTKTTQKIFNENIIKNKTIKDIIKFVKKNKWATIFCLIIFILVIYNIFLLVTKNKALINNNLNENKNPEYI
jgi:hypothetical protein